MRTIENTPALTINGGCHSNDEGWKAYDTIKLCKIRLHLWTLSTRYTCEKKRCDEMNKELLKFILLLKVGTCMYVITPV